MENQIIKEIVKVIKDNAFYEEPKDKNIIYINIEKIEKALIEKFQENNFIKETTPFRKYARKFIADRVKESILSSNWDNKININIEKDSNFPDSDIFTLTIKKYKNGSD